jgi:hypothetical protein
MKCLRLLPAALVLLLAALEAAAAQGRAERVSTPGERRTLTAARLSGAAPRLDGALSDEAWSLAQPASGFVQRSPTPGAPATLRTEARVLYDDAALYVSVRMDDPHPDSIAAPVGRRDLAGVSSDWAHVILDSYNDRRTAFRFSVNPAGVRGDALLSGDTGEDPGWDAVWETATRVDEQGWTAEFRIPLSQLRFTAPGSDSAGARAGQVWGLQITREIARRSEVDDWSEVRRDRSGFVSQFGELAGLSGVRPVRRLEVLPYTVARLTRAPGTRADPFYRSSDGAGSLGADVKYGLTSNLTLTATVNPDFGQVEADPSQVNLTAFESFYAERRPFFTEGADIFSFDLAFPYGVRGNGFRNDQPFYSRRLGRAPQGPNPDGALFADRPDVTRILGAAKVSGKTSRGWSIGLLNALTSRESVRFMDGGPERSAMVEPLTNYAVGRLERDFDGGNSAVGGIATAVNRHLDGAPGLSFLTSAAYLAGLNGRHRFGGGHYEARASVLGTHVSGSAEAVAGIQRRAGHYFQRPDADHLCFDPTRTSLSGWLANARVEKTGGGYLRAGLYGHARSPGLEMNDVGYQRTTDWLLQGGWIGYNHYDPQGAFRGWEINLNGWNGYSFGGERLGTGLNVNGGGTFRSNWGLWFGGDHELPALRADILRGGPAVSAPAQTSASVTLISDDRKVVSGRVYTGGWREWASRGGGWNAGAYATVRPSGRFRLSLGPDVSRGRDAWAYVATAAEEGSAGAPHYVMAGLDQTTVSLTSRLDYAFTPRLTLEFYAQPFVATGRYTGFKEVVSPRAGGFADRFRPYGGELSVDGGVYGVTEAGGATPAYTWSQPDFNVKELRSNLVLRWEYRPGSTLFLVWSQGRQNYDDPGSFRLDRDFGRLFDADRSPSTNVLLLKVNYWLGL